MATYQPVSGQSRESIPDLIRKLYEQATRLARQETELLKEEGKATAKKAGQLVAIGVVAAGLALFTLIFTGMTIMYAFAETGMDMVFAALITMAIGLALTLIAGAIGYQRLKKGYPELLGDEKVRVLE